MSLHLRLPDGRFAPATLQPVVNPDGSVTVQAVQSGDPFDPCPAPPPPPSGATVYATDYSVAPGQLAATLALLPTVLDHDVALHLAPGTYTEPVVATRFCGPGRLRVVGDAPGVVITGTASDVGRGVSWSAAALVAGPVQVELVNLAVQATAGHGIWAHSLARLRLTDVTVGGTLDKGIAIWDGAALEYGGTVSVSGFATRGVQIAFGSRATTSGAGTLSITGGANAWGLHVVDTSHFVIHAQTIGACHVFVDACAIGIQCGLNAIYTHQGAGGTTVLEDCAKGITVTDCSSWSTNKPLTYRRVASQRDINSMSYYEAVGGVTVQ